MTQADAARSAGVSLATWRRWEEDPAAVSAKTRVACEGALKGMSELERRSLKSAGAFVEAWVDSHRLTPRQAYAIAVELGTWIDTDIGEWLQDPSEPLHDVAPFDRFDLRVMMLVGDSRAWAEAVRQRCRVLYDEVEAGTLPFDRPGPLIDEVLIGAALDGARTWLQDMPELFERIPRRDSVDDDDDEVASVIGDDDWSVVSDIFDDECCWDEWEVPLLRGHPLLPAVLAERHPFRWFDVVEPTGAGYLQRLTGMVVDD
ncbi:hypothetical protein GIS00_02890 [Nakamurella sp. YIM 132087]|uniref:Uncharacterized protein n=1 Tax=Nakamurella alba TaxID=2665158 RepID=A0A7K1FFK8_9ACTN|nr:hypothetical protein [Nakamurella alba]